MSPFTRTLLHLALALPLWALAGLGQITRLDFFGFGVLYDLSRLPWLLGLVGLGFVALARAPAPSRPRVALVVSGVGSLVAYPLQAAGVWLLTLGVWLVVHHLGKGARAKIGALVALHLALAAGVWKLDAPEGRVLALVFVGCVFFRTLRYLPEVARRGFAPVPVIDFLAYMLPLPSWVLHPYLAVVPAWAPGRAPRPVETVWQEGRRSLWVGLGLLIAARGLAAGLTQLSPTPPEGAALWHLWSIADLWVALLYAAANAELLLGLMRVMGQDVPPAFNAPWLPRSLFDYWSRFIIHYKDLQVALFYFPTMIALRRFRKELAVVVATAMTFVVGNNLLHVFGRYLYTAEIFYRLPHAVAQNFALTAVMSAAFLWEDARLRRSALTSRVGKMFEGPVGGALRVYFTLAVVAWIWHL